MAPLLLEASATPAIAAEQPTHRVLARFSSPEGRSRAAAIAVAHRPVGRTGSELLFIRAPSQADALARVAAQQGVASVEEDVVLRLVMTPNDTYFLSDPWGGGGQWDMRLTRTDLAWDLQRGSAAVTVAVIDTGVDFAHPDLAPALLPGRVLLSSTGKCAATTTAQDDNGHGTHVAGTIAAVGQDRRGIAGVAFGVRILPFKTLDCNGSGRLSDTATAITDAADAGARVINLSVGSTSSSPTAQAAVDYATGRGSLVVGPRATAASRRRAAPSRIRRTSPRRTRTSSPSARPTRTISRRASRPRARTST